MLRRPSRSDWFFAAALLLFCGFWGLGLTGSFPASKPHTQENTSRAQTPAAESRQEIEAETVAYYTKALAWFTGVLAVVSAAQGIALFGANKTVRLTAEAAEKSATATIAQMRAYVSVVSAKSYGFDQDGESRILVRIGNTGDTVAFDVTGEHGVTIQKAEIFNFKGDLRPKDHVPIFRSRAGMGPKTTFDSFNIIPATALTPDVRAAIRAGTHGIFAYGEIRYKDALKNDRRTAYRLMYGGAVGADPNGLFVTCEEGNDSD